jgi:hypothetical protein
VAFWRPNRALSAGIGIAAVLLGIIFGLPGVRAFLGLGALGAGEIGLGLVGVLSAILALQAARLVWMHRLAR